MAEDVRQVEGKFRPCLDRVGMVRERPKLHGTLLAADRSRRVVYSATASATEPQQPGV